jgi:hypothetical protein
MRSTAVVAAMMLCACGSSSGSATDGQVAADGEARKDYAAGDGGTREGGAGDGPLRPADGAPVVDGAPAVDSAPAADSAPAPSSSFAKTAKSWSVPIHPTNTKGFFAVSETKNYDPTWSTFDIDGDGKPDLVLTFDGSDVFGGNTAAAHWKVYKNTGSGFAKTAISWAVPAHPTNTKGFFSVSETKNYDPSWSTFDIDGDDKPDLVFTFDASDVFGGNTAAAHWKVYKNTGSGFAKTAISWPVPAHPTNTKGFFSVSETKNYDPTWSTFDIDGDDKPDLVFTFDASDVFGGNTAAAHWKVYKNTGSGFAKTATSWPVPAHPTNTKGFFAVSETKNYDPTWSTFDIDGDGKPDLVFTFDASDVFGGNTAAAHWKVFKNTGSGFSKTALSWAVPAHPTNTKGFFAVSETKNYDPTWSTLDLDGDGKPDLVFTFDAADVFGGNTAAAHWKVFKNTGSGFSKTAISWGVPAHPTNTKGFFSVSETKSYDPTWSTFDLDGDGNIDLVFTFDASNVFGDNTATAHWKAYLAQ